MAELVCIDLYLFSLQVIWFMSLISFGLKKNQKVLCTSTSTEKNSMTRLSVFYWIMM